MAGTVKKLQFSEGTDVGAPTDLSLQTSTSTILSFVDDAAFVLDQGAAAAGNVYINSTSKKFRYYLGAWRNAVPESDGADPTKLFTVDLTGSSTGVTSNLRFLGTASRVYTFPNFDGTLATLAGTETLSGKTLASALISGGSLDVSAAGALALGASVGANNLTIGGASTEVIIAGNLTIQGTTTTLNTATLEVEDLNILVNNGGNDASAEGAGLTVERVSTFGSFVFDSTLATKWKIGLLGAEIQVADVSTAQTFTNKTHTSPVINTPITTSETHRGTLLLQNLSGAQPILALSEDPDNGTMVVNIQAPAALSASYTLTLPADDGVSGQVLQTDGAGVLTWASVSTFSGSSTDNAISRFDGTTGATQNSGVIIDDTNNVTGVVDFTLTGQLRIASGTVSEPGISFTADDDGSGLGLYRFGANSIALASNGINTWTVTSAGAHTFGAPGVADSNSSVSHIAQGGEGTGNTVFRIKGGVGTYLNIDATIGGEIGAKSWLIGDGVTAANGTLSFYDATASSLRAFIDTNGIFGVNFGMKFPATQVASADVNVLDDYEEGTFTPLFAYDTPGTSSFTYAAQSGTYTKIGRVVHIGIQVSLSAFTKGTASGTLRITGLPFAASVNASNTVVVQNWTFTNAPMVFSNGTTLQLFQMTGSFAAMSDPASNSSVYVNLMYFTTT